MATMAHRGKNKLVKRLTAQVKSKTLAENILKKRNLFTELSEGFEALASERAKDRAAKKSGKSPKAYKYNPKTNTATLKGK